MINWIKMNLFVSIVLMFISLPATGIESLPNDLPIIGTVNFRLDQATVKQRDDLKAALGSNVYSAMENKSGNRITLSKDLKIGDSKISEVSLLVKNIREGICSSLKKGDDFKFSIAWDASAKVWGIGIGTNTGIEATIHCN